MCGPMCTACTMSLLFKESKPIMHTLLTRPSNNSKENNVIDFHFILFCFAFFSRPQLLLARPTTICSTTTGSASACAAPANHAQATRSGTPTSVDVTAGAPNSAHPIRSGIRTNAGVYARVFNAAHSTNTGTTTSASACAYLSKNVQPTNTGTQTNASVCAILSASVNMATTGMNRVVPVGIMAMTFLLFYP